MADRKRCQDNLDRSSSLPAVQEEADHSSTDIQNEMSDDDNGSQGSTESEPGADEDIDGGTADSASVTTFTLTLGADKTRAIAHRTRLRKPPTLAPAGDATILVVQQNAAAYILRMMTASYNQIGVADKPKSREVRLFNLNDENCASALDVEAMCTVVFHAVVDRALNGYRGNEKDERASRPMKGFEADRDGTCAERMENTIRALRLSKCACRDALYEEHRIFHVVNAPLHYVHMKQQVQRNNEVKARSNQKAKDILKKNKEAEAAENDLEHDDEVEADEQNNEAKAGVGQNKKAGIEQNKKAGLERNKKIGVQATKRVRKANKTPSNAGPSANPPQEFTWDPDDVQHFLQEFDETQGQRLVNPTGQQQPYGFNPVQQPAYGVSDPNNNVYVGSSQSVQGQNFAGSGRINNVYSIVPGSNQLPKYNGQASIGVGNPSFSGQNQLSNIGGRGPNNNVNMNVCYPNQFSNVRGQIPIGNGYMNPNQFSNVDGKIPIGNGNMNPSQLSNVGGQTLVGDGNMNPNQLSNAGGQIPIGNGNMNPNQYMYSNVGGQSLVGTGNTAFSVQGQLQNAGEQTLLGNGNTGFSGQGQLLDDDEQFVVDEEYFKAYFGDSADQQDFGDMDLAPQFPASNTGNDSLGDARINPVLLKRAYEMAEDFDEEREGPIVKRRKNA